MTWPCTHKYKNKSDYWHSLFPVNATITSWVLFSVTRWEKWSNVTITFPPSPVVFTWLKKQQVNCLMPAPCYNILTHFKLFPKETLNQWATTLNTCHVFPCVHTVFTSASIHPKYLSRTIRAWRKTRYLSITERKKDRPRPDTKIHYTPGAKRRMLETAAHNT